MGKRRENPGAQCGWLRQTMAEPRIRKLREIAPAVVAWRVEQQTAGIVAVALARGVPPAVGNFSKAIGHAPRTAPKGRAQRIVAQLSFDEANEQCLEHEAVVIGCELAAIAAWKCLPWKFAL